LEIVLNNILPKGGLMVMNPMVQKKKNILQETVSLKKNWLVVSTHLKNISQNKNLPQIGMKIRKIETTDPILENDDLQLFQLLQPFEL